MIENVNENYYFNFVKEMNEDFKKISQVLHNSFDKISINKISVIDNILTNINTSLLNFIKNQINFYEPLLQKTEMQLRYHIKNEYMFRLQKDALENKMKALLIRDEEYERLKKITNVIVENGQFIINDRKENEIIILKAENSNLKKAIINYEKELENKNKIEKELKNEIIIIKQKYENKIKELKNNSKKKQKNSNSSININDISSNINNSSNKKKKLDNTNSLNLSNTNNCINNNPIIIENIRNPIKISTTSYTNRIQNNNKENILEIQSNFKNKHRRYKSEFYITKAKDLYENSFRNLLSPIKKIIEPSSTTNSKNKVSNLKYSTTIKNRNISKKISSSKLKSLKNQNKMKNLFVNTKSMINNFITYRNSNINNSSLSGSNFLSYKSN